MAGMMVVVKGKVRYLLAFEQELIYV